MLQSRVRDLFGHRDLVLQFTKREIDMRHKGSRLGHLWAVLRPASMLVLYLFVFRVLLRGSFGSPPNEDWVDFAVAMFLSISLFNIVLESMAVAPTLILNQPNYVKKVVFPLQIMSISNVGTALYHGILSALVAVVLGLLGHHPPSWWGVVTLPVFLVPAALFGVGISWALSAIGLFVRDVGQFIPFASQALMYASAVMYAPSRVIISAPRAWAVMRYNPFLRLIDEARRVVLWHMDPNYTVWICLYVASVVTAIVGYVIFSVLRPYFAEVI